MSFSKPAASSGKRKHKARSLHEKLKIIENLENGAAVASVCAEYRIAKQTVSDIRKKKSELLSFALKCNVDKETCRVKRIGIAVTGVEIQAAAERLAKQLGVNGFTASAGWLFRFCKCHNIVNRKVCGESLSADASAVEPFKKKLHSIMKEEGLGLNQVYNADETGLYWHSLPDNTQASKSIRNTPGRKISKERVSALLCANADGSHILKTVIVGKSKQSRAIKNIMSNLPVHYYHSKNAWFTANITSDWFHNYAVPEIRRHKSNTEVKAIILLDNAPAHPDEKKLCSADGKIICLFLPPNTTSLMQPMDQGVIYTAKRLYRKRFLSEVFEVEESTDGEDRRAEKTLQNIKSYNFRSMIFNFAAAVKDIAPSTLANAWNKILCDNNVELESKGIELKDYHEALVRGGEKSVTVEEIEDWLDNDGDPGYHIMNEDKIVDSVNDNRHFESEDEDPDMELPKMKLSEVKEHLNSVINFIQRSDNKQISVYFCHMRHLRELVVKEMCEKSQKKIDSFFKPK
ncbi:hypothetical protein ANN_09499 [Periplaneta americana]|uniref:HTH CENPB-type domain-containing protein n=1 Tax=Periplaneta americana TaxID=6978 RepID=A0ABQ8TLV3_PERAM|nr:hypothetical protein ANN_09499 [Periplaneta americana]